MTTPRPVSIPAHLVRLAADRVRDEVLRDWRDGLLSTEEKARSVAQIRDEVARLDRQGRRARTVTV